MTLTNQPLEIPLSKKKMLLLLLGSIAFVVAGFWLLLGTGFNLFSMALGGVAILFFGYCAVYIAHKLPEKEPGLILNEQGLIDHSSAVSVGLIRWSDIVNLSVIEIHRQKIILLEVANPEEYIDCESDAMARQAMQMNQDLYGTPLCISANTLQISFDALFTMLLERWQRSQAS